MDLDKVIGANVVRARKDTGDMSQQDLAEQMRNKGFKWSQATVWEVEIGKRPLRLAEAWEASKILKIALGELVLPSEQATFITDMEGLHKRIQKAWRALDRSLHDLQSELDALRQAVERLERTFPTEWHDDEVRKGAVGELAALKSLTFIEVEDAVKGMLSPSETDVSPLPAGTASLGDRNRLGGIDEAAHRLLEEHMAKDERVIGPNGIRARHPKGLRQVEEDGDAKKW